MEPELRASERIVVLLTPEEKRLVIDYCAAKNISVSYFVSECLIASLHRPDS
jgi:hypothetical protein